MTNQDIVSRLTKNPFPETIDGKPNQRHKDWNDGYAAGFLVQMRTNPGAGDVVAGTLARAFLNAVSPSVVRSLDKLGVAPGVSSSISVQVRRKR